MNFTITTWSDALVAMLGDSNWQGNPRRATPSLSNEQWVHSYCWQTFSSYIFSLGCDLFGGISAAHHCYFCWWSRQKPGLFASWSIYSSQRLFTSIYSCSFSATERRVCFFFSIDNVLCNRWYISGFVDGRSVLVIWSHVLIYGNKPAFNLLLNTWRLERSWT